MNLSWHLMGDNPRTVLSTLSSSPLKVLRYWENYFIRNKVKADMPGIQVSHLTETTQPVGEAIQPSGQILHGPLATTFDGKNMHAESAVVVHWPTVLHNITKMHGICPPIIFVVALFLPLFRRKSYYGTELLEKCLLARTETIMRMERPRALLGSTHRFPPSDSNLEGDILDQFLDVCANDNALVRSLQDSFRETFHGYTYKEDRGQLYQLARKYGYKDQTGEPYHLSSSIIRPGRTSLKGAPALAVSIVSTPLQRGNLYLPEISSPLYELAVAWEFLEFIREHGMATRKVAAEIYGLADIQAKEFVNDEDTVPTMIVNWANWIRYRRDNPSKSLTKMLPSKTNRRLMRMTLDNLAYEVSQAYKPGGRAGYSPRKVGVVYPYDLVIPEGIHALMGEPQTDSITFMHADNIKECLSIAAASELGRKHIPQPHQAPREKIEPVSGTLDYTNDYGNHTFQCVHTGRRVVARPPWHISTNISMVTKRAWRGRRDRASFAVGVVHVPGQGDPYYTYDFLFKHRRVSREFIVGDIGPLFETLKGFMELSRKDFIRATTADIEVGSLQWKHPNAFTPEEEDAIIKYYRPNASKEDMAKIKEICSTRSTRAIYHRVKVLRGRLIAEGEYDLKNLPHRQYNVNIALEIKRAQYIKKVEDISD